MKTRETPPQVSEYRIQAQRLLKQLRSDSSETATEAAARFRRLLSFSNKTIQQILDQRDVIRLKHALALIALEHGHESWLALKEAAETSGVALVASGHEAGREMYARGLDVLLNRWFSSYDEARASLEQQGGFLLPYERQFFVTEAEGIRVLGLDPDDADWERIGWDWVKPRNQKAWQRLRKKRELVLQRL